MMERFLEKYKNVPLRMWELREPGDWTPEEMDAKYCDQSRYVEVTCKFILITDAYEVPGDMLLEYENLEEVNGYYDDVDDTYHNSLAHFDVTEFILLSKVRLARYKTDWLED